MNLTAINIGDEIFRELGEPSDLSAASVSIWLKFNVGNLNIALNTEYTIDNQTMEISPALGLEEKDVFKKMYECYFYSKRTKETLGAAGTDQILEVQSDGQRVRKINKNELSKTYLNAQKDCKEDLQKMIKAYKRFMFKPIQTIGDDTIEEGTISSDVKNVLVDVDGQLDS